MKAHYYITTGSRAVKQIFKTCFRSPACIHLLASLIKLTLSVYHNQYIKELLSFHQLRGRTVRWNRHNQNRGFLKRERKPLSPNSRHLRRFLVFILQFSRLFFQYSKISLCACLKAAKSPVSCATHSFSYSIGSPRSRVRPFRSKPSSASNTPSECCLN